MYKGILPIFFIFFFTAVVNGQLNFRSGYVFTHENDTMRYLFSSK